MTNLLSFLHTLLSFAVAFVLGTLIGAERTSSPTGWPGHGHGYVNPLARAQSACRFAQKRKNPEQFLTLPEESLPFVRRK